MKVLNIHKRTISRSKPDIAELIATLSGEKDKVWPTGKWPAMKFEGGIRVGAKGGHGPIRYTVEEYNPNEVIQFRFTEPKGFNGIHKFELTEIDTAKTEIRHTIDMETEGKATWMWIFGIRPLHDALIEDAYDKIENNYPSRKKSTEWSFWVKFLRKKVAKRQVVIK